MSNALAEGLRLIREGEQPLFRVSPAGADKVFVVSSTRQASGELVLPEVLETRKWGALLKFGCQQGVVSIGLTNEVFPLIEKAARKRVPLTQEDVEKAVAGGSWLKLGVPERLALHVGEAVARLSPSTRGDGFLRQVQAALADFLPRFGEIVTTPEQAEVCLNQVVVLFPEAEALRGNQNISNWIKVASFDALRNMGLDVLDRGKRRVLRKLLVRDKDGDTIVDKITTMCGFIPPNRRRQRSGLVRSFRLTEPKPLLLGEAVGGLDKVVTEALVAVCDNVLSNGPQLDFRSEAMLLTPEGQKTFKVSHPTTVGMPLTQFRREKNQLKKMAGFSAKPRVVEERVTSLVMEVGFLDNRGGATCFKAQCIVGELNGMTIPIETQVMAKIGQEMVPVDLVISEKSVVKKAPAAILLRMAETLAGVTSDEVKGKSFAERQQQAESKLTERALPEDGLVELFIWDEGPDTAVAKAFRKALGENAEEPGYVSLGKHPVGHLPFVRRDNDEEVMNSFKDVEQGGIRMTWDMLMMMGVMGDVKPSARTSTLVGDLTLLARQVTDVFTEVGV